MLKIGCEVVRPGKYRDDVPATIPVPEELETIPGIPLDRREVDWYAREYPLVTMNCTERALRDYDAIRDFNVKMREIRKERDKLNRPSIMERRLPEPKAESTGEDVTEINRPKAKVRVFFDVGITLYDHRYAYASRNDWVGCHHVIWLAFEQNFDPTHTTPGVDAEILYDITCRSVDGRASIEKESHNNRILDCSFYEPFMDCGEWTLPWRPMKCP